MNVLDLFSGIGGFSLGLERAGFKTVAFCEIEEFPRKVLKKHWPVVPIYEDVRNVTRERLVSDGIPRIDIVTGGFPCQDISVAGNQKGIEAERSGLWSELCRIIGDVRPRYAIVENVTALISGNNGRWLGKVLGDLAEIGYDAEWHCISASELGAHHHRDRVWIICADTDKQRCNDRSDNWQERHLQNDEEWQSKKDQRQGDEWKSRTSEACEVLSNTMCEGLEGHRFASKYDKAIQQKAKPIVSIDLQSGVSREYWSVEPKLGRVANGIPDRSHRLKGLGNAVVPQIPELIGRAIMEAENERHS